MTIFNFRNTAGYVTDGAGETYVLGDAYPTARDGETFGWDNTANILFRDRDSGLGSRFAGEHLIDNDIASQRMFIVDTGNGDFDIRVAAGPYSGNAYCVMDIVALDGSNQVQSVLATVSTGEYSSTGQAIDAAGTEHADQATWESSNAPVSVTLSGASTRIGFRMGAGDGSSSYYTHIRTIEIASELATRRIDDIDTDNNVLAGQSNVTITTAGLDASPTTQIATLGGEPLTINSWSASSINVDIPADINLKWGSTANQLALTDDTGTVTLDNVTLSGRAGWEYVDYSGTVPNPATTESFHEHAQTDATVGNLLMATGDQLAWSTQAGLTIDADTYVVISPPATVSGSYRIYDDSTSSWTAESTFTITDSGDFSVTPKVFDTTVSGSNRIFDDPEAFASSGDINPFNTTLYRNTNINNVLWGQYPEGDAPPTQDPTTLPLASWPTNFTYEGAFRLPSGTLGGGRGLFGARSNNAMGLSNTAGRLFMAGTQVIGQDQGITEISIPTLSTSLTIGDLNTATQTQNFRQPFADSAQGAGNNCDIIGGVYVHNGKLVLTTGQIYDASTSQENFALVLNDPSDIVNSTVSGFYDVEGRFRAAAGWVSEVPTEWQGLVGKTHIMGNSSRYSIDGRASMGPSCFAFNMDDITGTVVDPVPTTAMLYYTSAPGQELNEAVNPSWSGWNTTDGEKVNEGTGIVDVNDVWTKVSAANFGFIVPGTRTYAVFGGSGGHTTGVGYKLVQDVGGNPTGGDAAFGAQDYEPYYWFYDMNDLLEVKNGTKLPYEVVPYSYGAISGLPYETTDGVTDRPMRLTNGVYDAANNIMYIGSGKVDDGDNLAVVLAYSIGGL